MYESYKILSLLGTNQQYILSKWHHGYRLNTTLTSSNIFGVACLFNNMNIKGSLVSPRRSENKKLKKKKIKLKKLNEWAGPFMCLNFNNLAGFVSELEDGAPFQQLQQQHRTTPGSVRAFRRRLHKLPERNWKRQRLRPPRLFGTSSSSGAHLAFQCCTATTKIQGEVFQNVLVLPLCSSYKLHFES